MDQAQIQTYIDLTIKLAIEYVPKIISAGVVLFGGLWAIKKILIGVRASFDKAGISRDIAPVLTSMVEIGLKVVLFFFSAGIVGIETASFVAMLAAAGFAIGLALQGSLGNFAAGIIILFFKPYKVGDLVSISDKFGEVSEIQIFSTVLITPGKKQLVIPNGLIIGGVVTNFSSLGALRLEISVPMPYTESYPHFESILRYALRQSKEIMQEPAPEIGIELFDTYSIKVAVRPFVRPENYWAAKFEVMKLIKAAMNEAEMTVSIPDGVEQVNMGA